LYAREQGKKFGIFLSAKTLSLTPYAVEPEELRQLQAAYRRRLQEDAHLFHPLTSRESLGISGMY
jgi:hypothetical protein